MNWPFIRRISVTAAASLLAAVFSFSIAGSQHLAAFYPADEGGGDQDNEIVEPVVRDPDSMPGDDESLYDGDVYVIYPEWQMGYIGSSSHNTYAWRLNRDGGYYSYSEPIVILKAGTRITFSDDNSDANGDTGFASSSYFVISSWKLAGSAYIIDPDGANYPGSGIQNSDIAEYSNGVVRYSYVTSEDNEIIRLCYRSGQSSVFTPERFPAVTLEYTGEKGTNGGADDEAVYSQFLEEQKADASGSVLTGKRIYALGDSCFAGNGLNAKYVWTALLAEKYSMYYVNYGMNGSTMSNSQSELNPICDRVSSMSAVSPDIIMIGGGKNDFSHSFPVGTQGSTDAATFTGALDLTIRQVKERYPDALIICVTPWNTPGTNSIGMTLYDYSKAMIDYCEANGILCFKACDPEVSGVDMTDQTFRRRYCTADDASAGLTLKGNIKALTALEKFIADGYSARN